METIVYCMPLNQKSGAGLTFNSMTNGTLSDWKMLGAYMHILLIDCYM